MAKTKTPHPTRGAMTVAEAGRKGGNNCRDMYGHDYYVEIGTKGGNKVRDLIRAGKRALANEKK